MGDDIDNVKASASAIVDDVLFDIPGARIAVVDYRDFPVDPYGAPDDYNFSDVLSFSTDKPTIVAAIQGLTLGNGLDWEESVYSALMHSIDSASLGSWRGSDQAAKVIILMGDAPPHDPEPFTGYTLSSVALAAYLADPVIIYPIQIGGTVGKFEELAEQTGGEAFTAENAGEVVDAILDAIEEIKTKPITYANGPYLGYVGYPITFDGTGSYDIDGTIVSYEWDLDDDGEFDDATGATPSKTWDGSYSGNIGLKITDNDGNEDVDSATVTVRDPVAIETATGTGTAYFASDSGTIEDLTALNESDLPEENPDADFPHGLFSFNITGLSHGETVNVTINFPEDIPTTAEYWKYNASSGEWYQIPIGSNDGDNIITITLQDGGIGDNDGVENGVISDPGAPGVPSAPPSAASTTPTGAPRDTYRANEDVYAAGSGFATGTSADIHVVHDQDWNDGDPIPSDVTGSVETASVNGGDIAPVLVWHAPLAPGSYDIVIDANRNGVYNAATDGLDSGSPGFVVLANPPPTPPTDVPALTPHGIIALVGLLCVIGGSRIGKRFS